MTIANGSSFSAPAAFGTDQSFLVWGDDNGSLTTSTPVTSATLTYERLDRTWQAKETGSVGDVQLAFDTTFLSDISPLPFLLVDNDRNFGSPRLVGGTLVGSQVVYGVDLADGEYFTLALNAADRLRLALPGNGSGTVTSSPAGVSCTASCDTTLDYRSTYVLTATLGDRLAVYWLERRVQRRPDLYGHARPSWPGHGDLYAQEVPAEHQPNDRQRHWHWSPAARPASAAGSTAPC